MSFPTNPSFGDTYYYPSLDTTYKYYGEPNGWQRINTSSVHNYFPEDASGDSHTHEADQDKTLTYTDGKLSRIDYENGDYKTLTYTDGKLTSLVSNINSTITTKTFTYTNGRLTSINIT